MIESGPFRGAEKGRYACIYADPPWFFQTRSPKIGDRDPRNHYAVMTLPEIEALPVADLAADDAHLFLWTTGPFLPKAFGVMTAWGFQYAGTGFVWIKTTSSGKLFTGLGYTTRKNAEFCLLGRRGNPKRLAKDVHEIIMTPVRKHSQKPEEAYERIERYCAGPRLELFARARRKGWACWGNDPDL